MTEHDFDSQIQDLISIGQWDIAYHVFEQRQYARRSEKGFPDYFLVRVQDDLASFTINWDNKVEQNNIRIVALEVKGTGGKLTDEQVICLEFLRLTGKVEVYALWPEDSDLAVEILK